MSRYRFNVLKVPNNAKHVATLDESGALLDAAGTPLSAPAPVVIRPDNSEGAVTVDLTEESYPMGTRIYVIPTDGADVNNVTVTPVGDLVSPDGTALDKCVLDQAESFAVFEVIDDTITILAAYLGADVSD